VVAASALAGLVEPAALAWAQAELDAPAVPVELAVPAVPAVLAVLAVLVMLDPVPELPMSTGM
jgi:hypothetical protein